MSSQKVMDLLIKAYNAEIETVMNYLAGANNLDGVRAEEVKESLAGDVTEELGHAQQLAERIRTLGGTVPGSQALQWSQSSLQPPSDSTNVEAVIRGVIEAEEDAIKTYNEIAEATDGNDFVTQDLAIQLLGDEEKHRREFVGFLREYQK